MTNLRFLVLAAVIGAFFSFGSAVARAEVGNIVSLERDWKIQAAAALSHDDDAAISSKEFKPDGWYATTVPSTVLGALVNDGVYTNIFFGTNF